MAEVDKEAMNLSRIETKEDVQKRTGKKKARDMVAGEPGVEKKKTFGERIADNFYHIDYEQIKNRLLFDWLFPEIISTLGDILRMIFSQDGRGKSRGSSRRRGDGYTHYNSIYDEKHRDRRDPTRQDYRKIRLEFFEREDAEDVLADLRERLESSNVDFVPVRDLYSLADLSTNSTMVKWVWYDLDGCRIERNGDNYVLIMPPAEPR